MIHFKMRGDFNEKLIKQFNEFSLKFGNVTNLDVIKVKIKTGLMRDH